MDGMKITYEIADSITLQNLRESKKAIQEDIDMLEKFVELEPFQKQDLEDDKVLMPHLDALIKYYGG